MSWSTVDDFRLLLRNKTIERVPLAFKRIHLVNYIVFQIKGRSIAILMMRSGLVDIVLSIIF